MTDERHPLNLPGDRTLEDLAVEVSILRYDRIAAFLTTLQAEIAHQAAGDASAGRTQLAALLEQESAQLGAATETMKRIWALCEPHMRDK